MTESNDELPNPEGSTMQKAPANDSSLRQKVAPAIVVLLRVAQYALAALAALTSMGALASQSMNAIAGAVLGVYVLVMLGFVWVLETLGVRVLKEWSE